MYPHGVLLLHNVREMDIKKKITLLKNFSWKINQREYRPGGDGLAGAEALGDGRYILFCQ